MTNLLIYLVQSSMVFSCLYILYKVIFSQVTFHQINRVVLLALPIIALLAPLSYLIVSETPANNIQIPAFTDFVSEGGKTITKTIEKTAVASYNIGTLFISVYLFVSFVILFKLIHSIYLIINLKKQSKSKSENNFQIIYTNQSSTFSFFNWIFLPDGYSDGKNNSLVIEHEKAHIQLKHSIDVFFSEVYIMLFWFNPLVYTYRKSLKSLHEYQADARVLEKNIKTSSYFQALLQNIEPKTSNSLYSYFNQSVIKKRIDMITKKPTRRVYKLTYSLLIIGAVILCTAFTKHKEVTKLLKTTVPQLTHINPIIPNTPPSLFPVQNGSVKDITSVYGITRRHPKVKKGEIHGGIDIRAKPGTPIIATADGVITKASMEGDWGNLIIIKHSDGYETWYAHLQGFIIKEKQSVKKGDLIGYVGNTGKSSGPHLHYEVKQHGKRLNPMDYLQ